MMKTMAIEVLGIICIEIKTVLFLEIFCCCRIICKSFLPVGTKVATGLLYYIDIHVNGPTCPVSS